MTLCNGPNQTVSHPLSLPQSSISWLHSLWKIAMFSSKQGDCKNAFCHPIVPENKITIIRLPPNCPISKPNTYWWLNKTLYGLQCSTQHWYSTLSKHLQEIGLRPSSHGSCLFVSSTIPGKPPIYVALYVDDFVYFSADSDIEQHFKNALASKIKVVFMGQVD